MAPIEIAASKKLLVLLSLLLILCVRAYTLVDFVFKYPRRVALELVPGHKDIYSCYHETYFDPLGYV